MRSKLGWISICFFAALIGAAIAGVFGVKRERRDLAELLKVLELQLEAELSQTVAVSALLATRTDVRHSAQTGRPAPGLQELFDRLVVQTGQYSILIADADGNIVLTAVRREQDRGFQRKLSQATMTSLRSVGLRRRITQIESVGDCFEVGLPIRQPGIGVVGFIVVVDVFEDKALVWRGMQDRFIVASQSGERIVETTPFQGRTLDALIVSSTPRVSQVALSLHRRPSALAPYILAGGTTGLMAAIALLLRRSALRHKQALNRARVQSLISNAELLEQRVRERTRLLRAETAQRKDTEAQLIQAAKFKVLGDLAAGVCHELSQPLFALQASLETLEKQQAHCAGAKATLAAALRAANRVERVLNNLRAFARNETETTKAVEPYRAVAAALEVLEARIKSADVQIVHTPPGEAIRVQAGPVRLQQVIVNVVSNALDALAESSSKRIEISYRSTTDEIEIVIADSGPGFESPDKAAEPFFTTKQDERGLGLGLSISKDILEDFGGGITLANSAEGGAQVSLHIPIAVREGSHGV